MAQRGQTGSLCLLRPGPPLMERSYCHRGCGPGDVTSLPVSLHSCSDITGTQGSAHTGTVVSLRDSTVGRWRGRQVNSAWGQIPFLFVSMFSLEQKSNQTNQHRSRLSAGVRAHAGTRQGWDGGGWKRQRETGQGHEQELLGPTRLCAVKGNPDTTKLPSI